MLSLKEAPMKPLFATLAALCIITQQSAAQVVVGRVVERVSRTPLVGVGVVLLDSHDKVRAAAFTDSVGRFRVQAPIAGKYNLSFQHGGLATLRVDDVNLSATTPSIVDTALTVATTLPKVRVVGASEPGALPGNPHRLDEFYQRKSLGVGTFLTRADIDSHANAYTQELFNQVPGLKVRTHGSQWYLRSQRCSGKFIPGLGGAGLTSPANSPPDESLDPMVFIDGMRQKEVTMLYELIPTQIEAIEIYQGAAEMPAEAKGNACFAIFVWLRR